MQIIDACPKFSAYNYCKSKIGVPPEERCGSTQTDALDIDVSAYNHLTGQSYRSGVTPNLKVIGPFPVIVQYGKLMPLQVIITTVDCPS